jgi:hypothetical protein
LTPPPPICALVCDDVQDVELAGFRAAASPGLDCLVRLCDTRQALIRGSRPLADVTAFLRVEGAGSGEITLTGNDLHRATKAVEFAQGARQSAILTATL